MELRRIVSLESRRAAELARLLERNGLEAIQAPSMQEVALPDQAEALVHVAPLMAGDFDILVLLTGVGFEMLCDVIATRHPREHFIDVLRTRPVFCRGPKPVAVLKRMGLSAALLAPEPNTWRELLAEIDEHDWSLVGKRVLLQEYGVRNQALVDGLADRGAHVRPVPIYAWRLPDDTGPLERAVVALCDDRADGLLVTSQQQFEHLLQVATSAGRSEELLQVLRTGVLVASIGPITTEALAAHGIAVDVEPQRPKMGHLVQALARDGQSRLSLKRQQSQ